jgi:transcriptional regulator with XRE-family HTH domain
MTQADFAETSGFDSAETISRWENGASVTGAYAEKLLRYAVHARLHKAMPATSYDPEDIAKMKIRPLAEGEMPMLVASLKMMRVSDPGGRTKRVIVYQIEDQIADRPTWT